MTDRQRLISSDFDFLEGRWTIYHRRLKERLANCREWIEFQTEYESWTLLGGLANADRLWGLFDGKYFEGVSVRTLDPDTGEWTIYWMDTRFPVLAEQVKGRFSAGIGEFFGHVDFEGSKVRVRFLWTPVSMDTARWEQAYQDPASGEWETNWEMDFRRRTA